MGLYNKELGGEARRLRTGGGDLGGHESLRRRQENLASKFELWSLSGREGKEKGNNFGNVKEGRR